MRQLFEAALLDPAARADALADAAAPAGAVFDARRPSRAGRCRLVLGPPRALLDDAATSPPTSRRSLVVDDLHWCDRPSLRFLAYLVNRLEGTRIGILAGLRSTEPGTDPALIADIVGGPSAVADPAGRR